MNHTLKTDSGMLESIYNGEKTAEFRLNDRNFQVGDFLTLVEFPWTTPRQSPMSEPPSIVTRITHIVRGGMFGVPAGYAMLSFKIVDQDSDVGLGPGESPL